VGCAKESRRPESATREQSRSRSCTASRITSHIFCASTSRAAHSSGAAPTYLRPGDREARRRAVGEIVLAMRRDFLHRTARDYTFSTQT
jgi:hypothetical protein